MVWLGALASPLKPPTDSPIPQQQRGAHRPAVPEAAEQRLPYKRRLLPQRRPDQRPEWRQADRSTRRLPSKLRASGPGSDAGNCAWRGSEWPGEASL